MSFFSFTNKSNSNPLKKPISSKDAKILPKDYIPKRLGVKYDPPIIILEYMLQEAGKLYHHKMKLTNMRENSNVFEMLEYLKKRHPTYLANELITDEQMISLLEKIKEKLEIKSISKEPASKLGKLQPLSSINNNKNTNNITNINTKPLNNNNNDMWTVKPSFNISKGNNNKGLGSDFLYAEELEEEDLNELDLNKLDNDELKKKKEKMDIMFNKNQKKPEDPDFEYDIQEDFDPKYQNEWDLDEDEDIV